MTSSAASLARGQAVFHMRLAGCGGCSDMVDMLLRDRFKGRPPIVECSSPRHARLIIVSGMPGVDLEGSVLEVLAQAPDGARVLLVGGCATGAGGPAGAGRAGTADFSSLLEADGRVEGCPVTIEAIVEGVEDVAG